MRAFKFIEHTADLGFEAYGNTIDELFCNAAKALLFALIDSKIKANKQQEFEITANNIEELLHDWLDELLFEFMFNGKVFNKFSVKIDDNKLKAIAHYGHFNSKKHKIKTEIKAITYHELIVKKIGKGWKCNVICDT